MNVRKSYQKQRDLNCETVNRQTDGKIDRRIHRRTEAELKSARKGNLVGNLKKMDFRNEIESKSRERFSPICKKIETETDR